MTTHEERYVRPSFSLGDGVRATSADVAREAAVSQATVSLVLTGKSSGRVSEATVERVLKVASRMCYRPNGAARSLRLGLAPLVGLAVPTAANPYFAAVLVGAEEAAVEHGLAVVLIHIGEDDSWREWLPELLQARGLDGCILYDVGALSSTEIGRLGRSVVLVEGEAPGTPSVQLDLAGGAAEATTHLIRLGHHRIGHLAVDLPKTTFETREAAYRRTLERHGIAYRAELVTGSTYDIESSTAAAAVLVGRPERPTAILCDDDLLAAGVYKAAARAGLRIPDDLSVVGFDDIELARMLEPELTTVAIPAREVGRAAIDAYARLAQSRPAMSTEIGLHLIERGSTAPPDQA